MSTSKAGPRNRENRPEVSGMDDRDVAATWHVYALHLEAERERLEEDTRRLRAEIQAWLDKYAAVNEMRAAAEAERDRAVKAMQYLEGAVRSTQDTLLHKVPRTGSSANGGRGLGGVT